MTKGNKSFLTGFTHSDKAVSSIKAIAPLNAAHMTNPVNSPPYRYRSAFTGL